MFHFDLSQVGSDSRSDLEKVLDNQLKVLEQKWGVPSSPGDYLPNRLSNLLRGAHAASGKGVVVLVDEYDKPLLNAIDNPDLKDEFKRVLKPFYSCFKSCDADLKFVMLTGVARFGKVSIFSDLNQLFDISFDRHFNAICGISESELKTTFAPSIENFAGANDITPEQALEELKKNYDGYHFAKPSQCEDIYNPFSLLNALKSEQIGSYWFSTGTPTFLIKELIHRNFNFATSRSIEVDPLTLTTTGVLENDPEMTLFQAGYFTIKSYDPEAGTYCIGLPNREVESGFDKLALELYTEHKSEFDFVKFNRDLIDGNPEGFMSRLKAYFKDFNYDTVRDTEFHYHNVLYILFKLLGFKSHSEYHTSDGRIDALVKTLRFIYVLEFKLNQSARAAIDQIDAKDYCGAFAADTRPVFKIGVNFTSATHSIDDYIIEPC